MAEHKHTNCQLSTPAAEATDALAAPGKRQPISMLLGIVLERRVSTQPWQDHFWRLAGIAPNCSDYAVWEEVARGDDWVRFAAGSLPLELFPRETDGYRQNLTSTRPQVFVILRSDEGAFDIQPFHVTVCPYEAQAYLDSGEDMVEGIDMPGPIREWVAGFIERHPANDCFVKRRQQPKTLEEADSPFWRPSPVTRGK